MFKKLCLSIAAFAAFALAAQPAAAVPPPTDFWLNKPFLNMAHQGGELEAPGNTLYAFKTAIKDRGADTLEMDGYLTKDNVFVITHDLEPYKTSNADNAARINQMTLAELKQLDFAYKFTPGKGHYGYNGTDTYPYRGIATGDVPPPAGYTANDFRIATLEEVLEAFPNTPLNVDMKAPGSNPDLSVTAATEVAKILAKYPERSEDVIVASFYQPAMVAFHEQLPSWKGLSAGEGGPGKGGLFEYALIGTPIYPNPVALQPPDWIYLGDWMEPIELIKKQSDWTDYAIHVWPNDHDPEQDTPPYYRRQIELGVDGLFTQVPSKLHEFLCTEGIPRPDGSPRCDQQICPEGQTGIAPNDCKLLGSISKVTMTPKKRAVKVGKKIELKVRLTNPGAFEKSVKANVRSSNKRVKGPKAFTVVVKPGASLTKTITFKVQKNAKGKAVITVNVEGKTARSTVSVKRPVKRCGAKKKKGGNVCGNTDHF